MEYIKDHHYVYRCNYHVIFCPKYRRKVLTDGVDERIKELFIQYAQNKNIEIIEMEVMPDHVHLLFKGHEIYPLSYDERIKIPTHLQNSYYWGEVTRIDKIIEAKENASNTNGQKNFKKQWTCFGCPLKHRFIFLIYKPIRRRRKMKINNMEVRGKKFAYDGCHKIYIIEDEEDEKMALKYEYKVMSIHRIKETYDTSCPLRFISNWKLNKIYVEQGKKAVFSEI